MDNDQPIHRFNLNIPGELWERIQKTARTNRRSVTQQILLAIDWSTRLHKENETDSFAWRYDSDESTEPNRWRFRPSSVE